MKLYKECEQNKPRILALTYPLFTAPKPDDTDKTENEITDDTNSTDSKSEDTQTIEQTEPDTNEQTGPDTNTEDTREIADKTDEEEDKSYDIKSSNGKSELGVYQNVDDFEMYEKLEWRIEEMEKALCCKMDLAEDIDGGKR